MKRLFSLFANVTAVIVLAALALQADTKKLADDQRRELVRGLTAEWAIAEGGAADVAEKAPAVRFTRDVGSRSVARRELQERSRCASG